MELKHQFAAVTNGLDLLLIVPYGIETYYTKQLYLKLKQLLIVPYGIETDEAWNFHFDDSSFNRTLWN